MLVAMRHADIPGSEVCEIFLILAVVWRTLVLSQLSKIPRFELFGLVKEARPLSLGQCFPLPTDDLGKFWKVILLMPEPVAYPCTLSASYLHKLAAYNWRRERIRLELAKVRSHRPGRVSHVYFARYD